MRANGLFPKPVILIIMLCCILGKKLDVPEFEKLSFTGHNHSTDVHWVVTICILVFTFHQTCKLLEGIYTHLTL